MHLQVFAVKLDTPVASLHRRKKVKMIFHCHPLHRDDENTLRSGVGGLWLSFKHQNGFLCTCNAGTSFC